MKNTNNKKNQKEMQELYEKCKSASENTLCCKVENYVISGGGQTIVYSKNNLKSCKDLCFACCSGGVGWGGVVPKTSEEMKKETDLKQ